MNNPFENDEFDAYMDNCIEYYLDAGLFTVEKVDCPENLWSILDRLHSTVMDTELRDDKKNFLLEFLSKWMNEIEPYCKSLEIE